MGGHGPLFSAGSPVRQYRANDRQQRARLVWREALHSGYLPDPMPAAGTAAHEKRWPAVLGSMFKSGARRSPIFADDFCVSVQPQKGGVPRPLAPTDFCDLELPCESIVRQVANLDPQAVSAFKDERRMK